MWQVAATPDNMAQSTPWQGHKAALQGSPGGRREETSPFHATAEKWPWNPPLPGVGRLPACLAQLLL